MRLKEIKPDMVIHCKTVEEAKQLIMLTDSCSSFVKSWTYCQEKTCYRMINRKIDGFSDTTYYELIGYQIVEFSDIILPELTAEEVLEICGELCQEYSNKGIGCNSKCPFADHGMSCTFYRSQNPDKAIEVLEQWKANQKKEPEIETVDICRIIEVMPDGRKRCVHEEDMDIDHDLPFEDENSETRRILKRYCMQNDGEFIAVCETVSRVKR